MNAPFRSIINLIALGSALVGPAQAGWTIPSTATPTVVVNTDREPVAAGKFEPSWTSLQQHEVPEWFRDAKFGLWAHFGPQSQPGRGDWYARHMYCPDHPQYQEHLKRYGHPSQFGFKDVIRTWQAENWDADRLIALCQRAGARYFVALANHHDNFDLWDSKYQPWNSVNLGPKKDLVAGWAAATRKHGMKFGVSVHAAHSWSWYESAQAADKTGPLAGVPYDGKLTKADDKGTWWEGYDPQDLYEQRHVPNPGFDSGYSSIWPHWNWNNGVSQPDQAFCDRFYNRTIDLVDRYQPDLLYFDDTALPLWPVSDAGLKIAAHFYNRSNQWRGDDGVLFAKELDADQVSCLVHNIERGRSQVIEPRPWQTDTCIGDWHYDEKLRENHGYKSSLTVVHALIDIVSKNGNLLLNLPLRGDGTLDAEALAVVEGIAAWMQINQEAIHGTRPWRIFGEGPQMAAPAPAPGDEKFNETKIKPLGAEDIRFTTKGSTLYAIVMGAPKGAVSVKSLGTAANLYDGAIGSITLVGSDEKLTWSQSAEGLMIDAPKSVPNGIAVVFKIAPRS